MKVLKVLLASALCLSLMLCFTLNSHCQELKLQKMTDNLYVISGDMWNIAFLVTDEGILVVDSHNSPNRGKEIAALIQQVTDKPIEYLVYTHHHLDHVLGSQSFPSSIKIISHINALKNIKSISTPQMQELMSVDYPNYLNELEQKIEKLKVEKSPELEKVKKDLKQSRAHFEDLKQAKLLLPEIIFEKKVVLHLGGKKVELLYMGNGHTNGDIMIYFPEEKVIHLGDLAFDNVFVYIERETDGESENWIKILEKVAQMDVEKIIPGHGAIFDKNGLPTRAKYLEDLRAEVQKFIQKGASLEETKEKLKLPKYEKMGYYDRFFPINVEAVYKEMTEKEN